MPLSSIGKIWAGETLIRRGRESLPPWVGVKIKDFGLTLGVYDETPIFLALYVPFRGAHKELIYFRLLALFQPLF